MLFLDEAEAMLNELILLAEGIYLNVNENDRYLSEVETRDLRYARLSAPALSRPYPTPRPADHEKTETVKSQYEVDAIQHAIDITGKAFRRVLEFVKPGVWEYEIEAEIIHEFIRNRCDRPCAIRPSSLPAKMPACCTTSTTTSQCQDGDVILMDFGCEYANYAADLTRSIPVNGIFTDRQRGVYNAVLRVLKEARAMLVPGTRWKNTIRKSARSWKANCSDLGLISRDEVAKQDRR